MRKRISCDACHLRKTKCDLEAVQRDVGLNSQTITAAEQAGRCSFCLSLGIPCRITVRSTNREEGTNVRHKRGRRIRALLADAEDEEARAQRRAQAEICARNSEKSTAAAFDSRQASAEASPAVLLSRDTAIAPRARQRSEASPVIDPFTSSSPTRPEPGAPAEKFTAPGLLGVLDLSVTALRACVLGYMNTIAILMPLTQEDNVFLARFEAFLRSAQGLQNTEQDGSEDQDCGVIQPRPVSELLVLAIAARGAAHTRYAHLADRLRDRFSLLLKQPDYLFLQDLDGIEAVVMMGEANIRSLHPISAGGRYPDCLAMDPLGKGFAAELCLFAKLNEEPPDFAPDYVRRQTLFWTIFCHDALRSASAGRMYRLHDDEIGWGIEAEPRKYPTVYLAMLARKFCRTMLSARARKAGIAEEDINNILHDFAEWPHVVGMSVDQLVVDADSGEQDPRLRVKQAMLHALLLRLSLSVWTTVQESGYFPSSAVMIRVEEHTARAAVSMVRLASVLLEHDLMEFGQTFLVGSCSAWILYLINQFGHVRSTAIDKVVDMQERAERLQMAKTLLAAVKSAKTFPAAHDVAEMLRSMLQRAAPVSLDYIAHVAESNSNLSRPRNDASTHQTIRQTRSGSRHTQGQVADNSRRTVTDSDPAQSLGASLNLRASDVQRTSIPFQPDMEQGHPTHLPAASSINTPDLNNDWRRGQTVVPMAQSFGQEDWGGPSPQNVFADPNFTNAALVSFLTEFDINMPTSVLW